ncbi:MAG: acyl carrier protein [Chitinophagaceae bacterium]|nr:MAG: acyl carrier protein [Chitinophagaceae bacterium]
MNKVEIVSRINEFLIDEFELEGVEIQPAANLKETLDLDSLDYVDLVVSIESNFGLKLVEADFAEVHSFQSFYDLIENKFKARNN